MIVDSYLELYTTMFGWAIFDQFFTLILKSGLIFIPFIIHAWENTRGPTESQESKDAWAVSINKMAWDYMVAIMIVIVALWPRFQITPQVIAFPDPSGTVNPSQSVGGYTFLSSEVANLNGVVKIPGWWRVAYSITGGINHAALSSMPDYDDARTIAGTVAQLYVDDFSLRQEYADFNAMCYLPARARLKNWATDGSKRIDAKALNDKYGSAGFDWAGGRGYVETPGLYGMCNMANCASLRATRPVTGWPAQSKTVINGKSYARDIDRPYQYSHWKDGECVGMSESQCQSKVMSVGTPYCIEWWNSQGEGGKPLGLKQRIFNKADLMTSKLGWFEGLTTLFNEPLEQDIVVKRMLKNTPGSIVSTNYAASSSIARGDGLFTKIQEGSINLVKASTATATTTSAAVVVGLVSYPMIQALPIFQAMLLFVLVALMPFLLMFAEFRMQALWHLTIAFFTIKFWSVLWGLASWVDNVMLYTMYSQDDTQLTANTLEMIWNNQTTVRALMEIITTVMYLFIPGLFSLMMGVAGIRVAKSFGMMFDNVTKDTKAETTSTTKEVLRAATKPDKPDK